MTADVIEYRDGYRYQLATDYRCNVGISGIEAVGLFITLEDNGNLFIRKGYAWDGPSGPAMDTPTFMRASLVHDALYQLMRERFLPSTYRDEADAIMRRICLEDGMPAWRAYYSYHAVRWFADRAADPANKKRVLRAP